MSVVVPGLMTVGTGVAPAIPLMFLICLAVCGHFLLPFHSLFMILGEGNGFFSTRSSSGTAFQTPRWCFSGAF